MMNTRDIEARSIKVGLGSCGIAAGGQKVYDSLCECFKEKGIELDAN